MVQGKINKGRHADHPAGCHSIRTNQCPPPPSSTYFFTGRMPFLPPNQQRQSTESIVYDKKTSYKSSSISWSKCAPSSSYPVTCNVCSSRWNPLELDRSWMLGHDTEALNFSLRAVCTQTHVNHFNGYCPDLPGLHDGQSIRQKASSTHFSQATATNIYV